jgi:hypothetical protein
MKIGRFLLLTLIGSPAIAGASTGKWPAFDESEVEWANSKGTAVVTGQASYLVGNKSYLCDKSPVQLVPKSQFTNLRHRAHYKTLDAGAFQHFEHQEHPVNQKLHVWKYGKLNNYIRSTQCSQGQFKFENVPAGDYFIEINVASISYNLGSGVPGTRPTGYTSFGPRIELATPVTVNDGGNTSVTLSGNFAEYLTGPVKHKKMNKDEVFRDIYSSN